MFSSEASSHPGVLATVVHDLEVDELPYGKKDNFILLYDLKSGLSESFKIPNSHAHCVIINPKRRHLALVLDWDGHVGCYVNLKEKKVIGKFSSSKGHVFHGHGTWSEDGSKIFLAERNLAKKEARVVIRDINSIEKFTYFSSNGVGIHDIQSWKDSLLVCNSLFGHTFEPNISMLNPLNGKVVKEWKMPSSKIIPTHIKVLGEDKLIVTTQSFNSGSSLKYPTPIISIDTKSDEVRKVFPRKNYSKMMGGLSLAYNKSKNIWATTFRHSNLVGFFDVKNDQLLGSFYLRNDFPRGVFSDVEESNFLVTTEAGNLFYIDSSSLKVKKEVMNKDFLKNKKLTVGAHFEVIPKSVLEKI